MDVLTYCFEYPSLEELLIFLNSESQNPFADASWKDEDIQLVLRSSGLQCLDDFTLVPSQAVYKFDKLSDNAVRRLYIGAEKMLQEFHSQKANEIAEIEELLREWAGRSGLGTST